MTRILRRISLPRLLILCTGTVAAGALAAVGASALEAGPLPAPMPLAKALYTVAHAARPAGLSAQVTYTDHLFEGAALAEGGQGGGLASSPLVKGASGRIWISSGRVRVDLEATGGDTEIVLAKRELTIYDVASNTVYRLALPQSPAHQGAAGDEGRAHQRATMDGPSLAQIESALSRLSSRVRLSGAEPTDVAGRPAYMVRIAPKQSGSLIGELALAFDSTYGTPLRTALYSVKSPSAALELALSEVSYGAIGEEVFDLPIPAGARVVQLGRAGNAKGQPAPAAGAGSGSGAQAQARPAISRIGSGVTSVLEFKSAAKAGSTGPETHALGGEKVRIDGAVARQLATELGTILTLERGGYEYIFAGALEPGAVQAAAAGG
jgi:outer membrane lipoprotein-sorting protein